MAGVVALLLATAACAVKVPDTSVSVSGRAACARLVDALPDQVSDQPQRETRGNPLGAAWGDPAIVLRCGVGDPADYDPLVGCMRVNGVDWYAPESASTDQSTDVVLTTIGRAPAVELLVPAEHRPPAAALVDVAAAIKKSTRVFRPCS